jgi:heme oxygenase
MWQAFGAKLRSISTPANDDAIVASANRTFAVIHDWMVEARR